VTPVKKLSAAARPFSPLLSSHTFEPRKVADSSASTSAFISAEAPCSDPALGTFQVFVRYWSGTFFTLHVTPSDTILSIKMKVLADERIPVGQQHLIFAGRELANALTVTECNIHQDQTLHLAIRPTHPASQIFIQILSG